MRPCLISRFTEHFSVDSTLIEAWASMKSFEPKEPPDAGVRPKAGGRKLTLRTVEREGGGGSAGDDPLRDAAGQAASDSFRRAPGDGRRREREGVPVRGDARLLAAAYVRPFRNERQDSWFSGLEGAFPALRRDHRGSAARPRSRFDRPP